MAFVSVRGDDMAGTDNIAKALAACPEFHDVAGEDCYLVTVRAKDPDHIGHLLRFAGIPRVRSARTTIALETVKGTSHLPVARADEVLP